MNVLKIVQETVADRPGLRARDLPRFTGLDYDSCLRGLAYLYAWERVIREQPGEGAQYQWYPAPEFLGAD
jgi:hypothetical protein